MFHLVMFKTAHAMPTSDVKKRLKLCVWFRHRTMIQKENT